MLEPVLVSNLRELLLVLAAGLDLLVAAAAVVVVVTTAAEEGLDDFGGLTSEAADFAGDDG